MKTVPQRVEAELGALVVRLHVKDAEIERLTEELKAALAELAALKTEATR